MKWLATAIFSLFGFGIKELAVRAAIAIGMTAVTTTGVYTLLTAIQTQFVNQLSGLPIQVIAMLGLMKVDIAFTMILSAVTAKFVMQGWSNLAGGTLHKRGWNNPGSGGSLGG